MIELLVVNLAVTIAIMLGLWTVSLILKDPSFIDAWWSIGLVLVGWIGFLASSGDPTRRWLLLAITTVWGVRLGGYLLWRWRKNGPDKRYMAMIRHAPGNPHLFTLTRVFLLQGALLWIISLPIQLGMRYHSPQGLLPSGYLGVLFCVVGFAFESVGDLQLVRFKAKPQNDGHVMDRGLWHFTRHPNYFGDSCMWWGLFLISVVNPITALALVSPVLMTFLLVRWSGAGPLEKGLRKRKPDYVEYVLRTSSFIPMPPKRLSPSDSQRSTP